MIVRLQNIGLGSMQNLFKTACFMLLFLLQWNLRSQESGPEQWYTQARTEAFENKDYQKAIELMVMATQKSPNNVDYNIFLGRLYTWDHQTEKARQVLTATFDKNPTYEDAALAYGSLEFWNDSLEKALDIVNKGLTHHPESEDLLILKAKILMGMKEYQEASTVLNLALKSHPKSTAVRSMLQNMGSGSLKNEIGLLYHYVTFNEQFDDPWHIASLHYQRQTNIGALVGRFNYGNRFGIGATQLEVDFYPRLSKMFYAYLNAGISNNKGVFPEFRSGFSLYANLPAAFEVDAGFRYLKFTDDNWIYTFGLGKYYRNYWFKARAYLSPSSSGISDSYALEGRYYFGGSDDYVMARIGTGFSPDNTANNVLYENATKLKSDNVTLGFRKLLGDSHVIYTELTYGRIEFQTDTFDDQYSLKLGYIKRF